MSVASTTQLKALAARALSGAGTTQSPGVQVVGAVDWVAIQVNCTATGGSASPTLTLSVQWSQDNGTTWADSDPADSWTAIALSGTPSVVKRVSKKGDLFRLKEVVAGTTPSVTYDCYVNYR